MLQVLEKYSTRTQLVLHRPQITLCIRWTVGSLKVVLSTLHLLLYPRASFPDIELNLSRRVLLLSST